MATASKVNLPAGWGVAGGAYDTPEEKIAYFNSAGITPNQLLAAGVSQEDINWMRSQPNGYNVANFGASTVAPAPPSPYVTDAASQYQSYTDTVGDAEQTIQPNVPHERIWVALARQEGIEPEIYQGVGDSYEAAPNPAYLAWKEAKKAEGLDVGVNQTGKYTADYVILKNGVPITEPQSFKTGSTLAEGLVELAPIALAAFGGHLYGAGGVGLSAAEQAAAIAAGDVLGGVGAAGAGLGATGAGAGGAGFVGLESELAGLAAAEAGMGGAAGAGLAGLEAAVTGGAAGTAGYLAGTGAGAGGAGFVGLESELAGLAAAEAGMAVPGAALPGIETALAGGAAGVSAYEAAAATKAAADIAAKTAATPPPGTTPPGTTPPGTTPPGTTPPETTPPGTTPGTTLPGTTPGTTLPNVPAGTVPWGEIIGTLGSLYGGSQAAEAGRDAAQIQADALREAARLQNEAQTRALSLQERMYLEGVARQAPWLQAGQNALAQMSGLTNAMPEAFQYTGQQPEAFQYTGQQPAAFQFRPEDLQLDPGYGFRLSEGIKALERSAAARGGLMSGGTGKALTRYGQEAASQEFGNAFNRAFTQYGAGVEREQQQYGRALTGYESLRQREAEQYNRALTGYNALRQREAEQYNRLAGLAGVGGTTAQQLTAAGQQYGSQAGNLLSSGAANLGNLAVQQGTGSANALLAGAAARQSAYGDVGEIWGRYFGGGR